MSDPAYDAISKAKRQVEGGNPKGAVTTLEAYLESDPYNIKPRLYLAHVAYYDLNDEEYGNLQMNIILDLEPNNIEALKASLAILSNNKKSADVAEERFEKVISLSSDAETCAAFARFLRIQRLNFKRSAEYYEKSIELSPNKYEFHQNYAVLLIYDLKDYVKAKHELEEVLRIDPSNVSAKKNYNLLISKKFDGNGNLKRKRFSLIRK